MNIKIQLLFTLLFFGTTSFSQITEIRTGLFQINCKSIQSDLIELEIWATKRPSRYRIERACRDAITANLFSSISSSSCGTHLPLLSNSAEIQNFNKIRKEFFNNGSWRIFVRNSTVINQKKGHYIISIDRNGLRNYLIENHIITNLNKGF
jgi:hypothetical protein